MGCIVLGRGENEAKVETWLTTAAAVPGIGFAVGRTTFWDALVRWRDGRMTRERPVANVAEQALTDGVTARAVGTADTSARVPSSRHARAR